MDLTQKHSSARQHAVLKSAIDVFARLGYRKASMDEVARAAGVSRQGLYLHFSNKEELFRACVVFALSDQLNAAESALSDPQRRLEERLIAACDEWSGRYVSHAGANAIDTMEHSVALAGGILAEYEGRFESALAQFIINSKLMPPYAKAGLSCMDLARTLHVTAQGLKHSSTSRALFVQRLTTAVRILCTPIQLTP